MFTTAMLLVMVVLPVLQLLATLAGPGIAAWFVVRGWKVTHEQAETRAVSDWRRSTLAETTAKFLEVAREVERSHPRLFHEIDDDMLFYQTSLNNLDISQVFSERIATMVSSTRRLGNFSMILFNDPTIEAIEEGNTVDQFRHHLGLVSEQLMVELGLKKQKPAPEGYAYVVGGAEDPSTYRPPKSEVRKREVQRLKNLFLPPSKRVQLKPWKP